MQIRFAKLSDKEHVLDFCKNTFPWGDYIQQVWNFWYNEGYLLVFEKIIPVGLIHAYFYNSQVWIEGIRVDKNFRHQKIATHLISKIEKISKRNSVKFSYMLIDIQNIPSMNLAKSLGYRINSKWNFYTLEPKKNSNFEINFIDNLNKSLFPFYIDSWRWIPLTNKIILELKKKNQIIESKIGNNLSIGIITHSKHFEKTILVTIYGFDKICTDNILSYIQNYASENHIERIQVLSPEKLLSEKDLDLKLEFNHMKKKLF